MHPAIFNLGFRPFFTGACIFAVISIAYWLSIYLGGIPVNFVNLSPFQWHAHEMIYGYSLAVISGFLLTAVKNWTSQQTPHDGLLAALFSLWLLARLTWLFDAWLLDTSLIKLAAFFDLTFVLALMTAISLPIIRTKKWRQLAILTKLILLGTGNLMFYLGLFGYINDGVHLAIYGGLYLIIGLILTIGRRLIPFFIKLGVDSTTEPYNVRWLDLLSLVFFLVFFISELFLDIFWLPSLATTVLSITTTIRIIGWYTPGIWKTPLLWSLLLSLGFIDLGFIFIILRDWFSVSPYLATHAFGVGGIGVITMGMMARVTIGHTGRNLKSPPAILPYSLGLLLIGTLIRVVMPIFDEGHYTLWLGLSGGCWLLSFTTFCYAFLPILSQPRIDQKYG